MPRHPNELEHQDTNFFKRWSDRKTQASEIARPRTTPEPAEATTAEAGEPAPLAGEEDRTEAPAITEADLENLTYESDYTKFMGEQVPEALRRRALRQLWRSDPILANLDGLCDYDDDYTDAALAVAALQTAHKVGQGYLTDEEVAANRARGEPATEEKTKAQETTKPDNGAINDTDETSDNGELDSADASKDVSDAGISNTASTNTDSINTASKPDAEKT